MGQDASRSRFELCYTDTGGTFTDCLIVDEIGNFFIGKVATTPHDPSICYFNAVDTAAREAGITLEQLYDDLAVAGYGATTAINTLITRTGARVGLLITKGFEKLLMLERGLQPYLGLNIDEVVQGRTHRHTEPLVPLSLIKGVTERIDCLGKVVVPLYEHEVKQATLELLEKDVDAIAVGLLFSWLNSDHEQRVGEIIRETLKDRGLDIPIYLRAELCPRLRELPSINTTILEAYIAPKAKKGLSAIDERIKSDGFKMGDLGIMLSTGGLTSVKEVKAVETIMSGPAGGLVGARYIGDIYGFNNIITTDVGGTSFDVGIITHGMIDLNREPSAGQLLLGVPMLEINSIGAGGGTLARLDPLTGRLSVGPQSAGADPGPVCYNRGGEIPTVTDADVVLGYIDPDYFLGGKIKLNKEKALTTIREKIAAPLGLDVTKAAYGIKQIIDTRMRDTINGMAVARGMDIQRYHILGVGGAGPTHMAGYTEGIPCKGVLAFPYSSIFCAFGASSADYEQRQYCSSNIIAPPGIDDAGKLALGGTLNDLWEQMEVEALNHMERQGFKKNDVTLLHQAMVRYGRQLDDLIVNSPVSKVNSPQDWDKLIAAFESLYEQVYAKGAQYPQAGYEILEVSLVVRAPKVKPRLQKHPRRGDQPSPEALKGHRSCYFVEDWVETPIYNGALLQPGNHLKGPVIVEYPSSSLVVPSERSIDVDEYLTVWIR
jgi:N-methylhydantoinase A